MKTNIEFPRIHLPDIDDAKRRNGRVAQVPELVYGIGGNHYVAELLLREIEEALA